jgi:ADP-ribose pyrophosphatase
VPKFRIDKSRIVYKGRIFNIRSDDVVFANGIHSKRGTVVHPGSVAIVPMPGKDRVVLIRQFRLPLGKYIWEIPAGTLEAGESPAACARREIMEETGYRACRLKEIMRVHLIPGYGTEMIRIYVATGLIPASAQGDPDEFITVKVFSLPEALRMINTGRITDAKTIIGLWAVYARVGGDHGRRFSGVSLPKTRNWKTG